MCFIVSNLSAKPEGVVHFYNFFYSRKGYYENQDSLSTCINNRYPGTSCLHSASSHSYARTYSFTTNSHSYTKLCSHAHVR